MSLLHDLMLQIDNWVRLNFFAQLVPQCCLLDVMINSYFNLEAQARSHIFSCPMSSSSSFSSLGLNTLMTLLSESHIAQSEFNISEIRQKAWPRNPCLAGSAEANGVRRGGSGWSCHSPAAPLFCCVCVCFLFFVRVCFKNSCWTAPE